MKPKSLIVLKITLTIALVMYLVWASLYGSNSGVLREVEQLGIVGSLITLAAFFILVAFYCRDLQKLLEYIDSKNRVSKPKSVWLMFLIPYNFVEDFFIIFNIYKSLSLQSQTTPELQNFSSFGLYSGLGWCTAQIGSFAPGYWGQSSSLIAIVLWVFHWRLIRRIKSMLSQLPNKGI